MRNLLEEFRANHGLRPPTILGVREHVFTGRHVFAIPLSMLSNCMYNDHIFLWNDKQCIFVSIIHVKPRNKLCDLRSTCFSKSLEVSKCQINLVSVR